MSLDYAATITFDVHSEDGEGVVTMRVDVGKAGNVLDTMSLACARKVHAELGRAIENAASLSEIDPAGVGKRWPA